MANLEFTATTDFNADGEFSECEVDMAWATLQVKALLSESSTNTITINSGDYTITNDETFLSAVKAQHALNVSGTVAQSDCGNVSSLPLGVSVNYGPLGLSNILGYWRMNEQGPDYPAKEFPLYDSSLSKNMGTATKAAVDDQSKDPKYGLGLYNWSSHVISDSSGTIFSNSSDWTFHSKIFVESGLVFMIKKGNFKIPFNNPAIYVASNSGVATYSFPAGVTQNTFNGTFIDLFLRMEGEFFKIDIIDESGNVHSFGSKRMDQGLFDAASVNADIEILGKGSQTSNTSRSFMAVCWFSEVYVLDRSEETLSSTFNLPSVYRFLYDGDGDNTYDANTWTDSKTGDQLTIVGDVTKKTGGQSHGGSVLANVSTGNYISQNNFDLTQDFTFSCWYRRWGNAPGLLSILDGTDGLDLSISGSTMYLSFDNTGNGKGKWAQPKVAASGEAAGTWHHLALVKSNGRVAVFIDGSPKIQGFPLQIRSGSSVNDSLDTGLTNCVLKLEPGTGTNISDIVLIQGGAVRVNNAWALGVPNDASNIEAIKDRSYFA
jgi:hypothetical protein